jgi:hypothetical protein
VISLEFRNFLHESGTLTIKKKSDRYHMLFNLLMWIRFWNNVEDCFRVNLSLHTQR